MTQMKFAFIVIWILLLSANNAVALKLPTPLVTAEQSPPGTIVPSGEQVELVAHIASHRSLGNLSDYAVYARLTDNKWTTRRDIEGSPLSADAHSMISLGSFPGGAKIDYTVFVARKDGSRAPVPLYYLPYKLSFSVEGRGSECLDVNQQTSAQGTENKIVIRLRKDVLEKKVFARVTQEGASRVINAMKIGDHDYAINFPQREFNTIKYLIGIEMQSGKTRWCGKEDTFIDYDFIDTLRNPQIELVNIGGHIREIGYGPQSCEGTYWDTPENTCRCCLIKSAGRFQPNFNAVGNEIVSYCENNHYCTPLNTVRIKEADKWQSLSNGEFLKALYKNTALVQKLSSVPLSLRRDSFLTDDSLEKLLRGAYRDDALPLASFAPACSLNITDILGKEGGANTLQLFKVDSKCPADGPQSFIVREASHPHYETVSLEKIRTIDEMKPLILPHMQKGYPSIALPLAYLGYSVVDHNDLIYHTLSIQPSAPGEPFCQFIKRMAFETGADEKIWSAYEALGYELANFQKLFYIGTFSPQSSTTIVHGDLRCSNVFYDSKINHFTFIDNESMEKSIDKRQSPSIDINQILFGNLKSGEDSFMQNLLNGADLGRWYHASIGGFVKGYSGVFPKIWREHIVKGLMNIFQGAPSHGYEARLTPIINQFVRPAIDSFKIESLFDEQTAVEELRNRAQAAKSTNLAVFPSPKFWGDHVVYSIMVDRFLDANPVGVNKTSIKAQKSTPKKSTKYEPTNIGQYRHGGDIQGIIDRLAYIKDLGATAIMISSLFENNGDDYHGYCVSDFTKIDSHFGTNHDLQRVVDEAHRHGLYVILDVVINHFCDINSEYTSSISSQEHLSCAYDLKQRENRNEVAVSNHNTNINFASSFFRYFAKQKYFNRCGVNTIEETESEGPATFYGDFAQGMFDLNTRDPELQEMMVSLMAYWIGFANIDGYRLDAAKHTSTAFTAVFASKIRDYASSIGKSNFLVSGEIAGSSKLVASHLGKMTVDKGATLRDRRTTEKFGESIDSIVSRNVTAPFPGLNGVYEFGQSGSAVKVLQNLAPINLLANHFSGSDYRGDLDVQADLRNSFSLLEIHDWPRFTSYSPTDPYKSRLSIEYLAAAEGIPIIYYGQEQGFTGTCPAAHKIQLNTDEKTRLLESCKKAADVKSPLYKNVLYDEFYRQDMFQSGVWKLESTVKTIGDLANISNVAGPHSSSKYDWLKDPFLNRTHEVYQSARRFLHIRQSCSALRWGNTRWVHAPSSTTGVSAFIREDKFNRRNSALVVVNNNFVDMPIPDLAVGSDLSFKSLHNKGELITNKDGWLQFQHRKMDGNSVKLFVADHTSIHWNDSLGTYLCDAP